MEYIYEIYLRDRPFSRPEAVGKRVDTCSRLEDLENTVKGMEEGSAGGYTGYSFWDKHFVTITKQVGDYNKLIIQDEEDLGLFREGLERVTSWKDKGWMEGTDIQKAAAEDLVVADEKRLGETAVNPAHYQNYLGDFQWIEAMSEMVRFRDPEQFKAALELQVRKYLDRGGRKGAHQEDLEKALWYLKYLVAFGRNGCRPTRYADVDRLLRDI